MPQLINNFYILISTFGNSILLAFTVTLIILVFLVSRKYHKEAFLVILASLSVFFSGFIKIFFKYPRPQTVNHTLPWESYSFPSSHVLYYVVFFGYLLYLSYKLKKVNYPLRISVAVVCTIMITFVGFSRLYLNVHWLRDVYGGYFFGASYLAGILILDKLFCERREQKRR
jgi:undecaprenyl-diphosphatase